MSRIADYVKTLGPAERERFADLIDECYGREAAIADSSRTARAALLRLEAGERELRERIQELRRLSFTLRDNLTRLYLAAMPPQGRVN